MKYLRFQITENVRKNSMKMGFVPVDLTKLLSLKTGIKLPIFLLIIIFQQFQMV